MKVQTILIPEDIQEVYEEAYWTAKMLGKPSSDIPHLIFRHLHVAEPEWDWVGSRKELARFLGWTERQFTIRAEQIKVKPIEED